MILLLLIVGGLLSVAGLTLAQSSASYDLGCWGVNTVGGGERQSGSFLMRDAVGQTASGRSESSLYSLNAGYIQNWATLQSTQGAEVAVSATTSPDRIEEDGTVFLPIVQNFVRLVRPCSF